ncbi:hypothetical protein [Humibacter ginsenosidimutans]|uniref:Uncharacterized protein n=1 Tax=Humibacter ginsenosidimutans TaxID=2599293 RepID=A0A5B8M4N8_9MICO|nr:hypothetical protein [Humibacter ginsenosidimutans]QDZ15688.1 hypothetical protein FPZ11_13800 [Humibacter ginsenosidimutans]
MSSKSKQGPKNDEPANISRGNLGWLAGLITMVVIAFPLSAAIAYATHPATRTLFGSHLSNTSAVGFSLFWWVLALLLIALPFLVGFGVSKLSSRWLSILGGILALLVIALIVLGQLFAF